MTDLWGPIDPSRWQSVPCVSGRAATEADVAGGQAVFFVQGHSEPAATQLPACGWQTLSDGSEIPVIVIQAEIAPYGVIFGVRPLSGGNGVCASAGIRLLPGGFGQ